MDFLSNESQKKICPTDQHEQRKIAVEYHVENLLINLTANNQRVQQVLVDYGYQWDSSASVPPTPVPIWPYTLDYAIPHECRSGTCPTRPFPG